MIKNEEKWLTNRLLELNISKVDFCRQIEIQPQHFKWFEGKPKQRPSQLEKISHILRCDFAKLSLFWDNKISSAELFSNNIPKKENNKEVEVIKIDILDVRACCGSGIENFSENVIGQQMMTLPALREFTSAAPENIKIIKAIGESMLPTIHPNDIVWIDISIKSPTSDGLYVLCVGNDLMIKRIQINPFDNSATIISDNLKYANFQQSDYKNIRVVGKVIYHMKKIA